MGHAPRIGRRLAQVITVGRSRPVRCLSCDSSSAMAISGNSAKFGLKTLAGVIDENYRGSLQVLLTCVKSTGHEVKKGDRIAQLVVVPCVMEDSEWVEGLSDTERGDKGFGSSGR